MIKYAIIVQLVRVNVYHTQRSSKHIDIDVPVPPQNIDCAIISPSSTSTIAVLQVALLLSYG